MSENMKHWKNCIVWLKTRIDDNDGELEKNFSKTYINFQIFEEVNACINFISDLPNEFCRVFLILVDIQYEYLAEMIIDLPQLAHIYLYEKQSLASNAKFIRFSTNNPNDLFYAIARDIELKEGIPSIVGSFSYSVTTLERSVRDLCSEHQSATFVWFQLLIEVIRQLPHTTTAKDEMLIFLNEYFHDSPVECDQINQFAQEYKSTDAIFWYTKVGFLFRIVNRAFRTQNIDNLFKLRYFLQDLYNEMEKEYVEQREYSESIRVYRGQMMFHDDFHALQMNNDHGNLIAFNSFLSTTFDEHAASIYSGSQTNTTNDEVSVLFQIELIFDKSDSPFASISHLSAVRTEEEILVAMGSVFRIDQIIENQQEKRWDVRLTSNKDVNERLTAMIQQVKHEIGDDSTLLTLGRLLGDMGDLYRAERYFRLLLEELPSDHPDLGTILNNLGILAHKHDEHEKAIEFFQRALLVLPKDHGDQSCAYANLGASYQSIGDDETAIEFYEKAIQLTHFPSDKAKIYNNIGSIYRHRCQYNKSIDYHQLSLHLQSSDDFESINARINLALTYLDASDYTNALIYCQQALNDIHLLPIENILIGKGHFVVGYIKAKMNQHIAALIHFSDALNAYHRMSPSSIIMDEIVKTLYEQGRSYMELDQNQLALTCFNEILSMNHSHDQTAFAHHSIGQIYDSEGAFRRALQSYFLALNIWTLLRETNSPIDRHAIAQLLNDIGEVYDRTKQYGYALWYYAQAIEYAKDDDVLTREYLGNFRAIADRALDILDVYFL